MFTKKGDGAVLAKIRAVPAPYSQIGETLHAIVRETAPDLEPIVRWGLPFYVRDGKDICYIKPDPDYIVFGFGEEVNPAFDHDADMHPIAWTFTALGPSAEARIRELVAKVSGGSDK